MAMVNTSLSLIFTAAPALRCISFAPSALYQSSTKTYNSVKKVSIGSTRLFGDFECTVLRYFLPYFQYRTSLFNLWRRGAPARAPHDLCSEVSRLLDDLFRRNE